MHSVNCPNCGKSFVLDDSGYADIASQVKGQAFEEELRTRLDALKALGEAEGKLAQTQLLQKLESEANKKTESLNAEIQKLKADLKTAETEKKLAVSQATAEIEKAKAKVEAEFEVAKREADIALRAQRDEADVATKALQEQIAFYKDLKAKQSNKILGESLEQHCEIEFNKIRAAAFPNAQFGKDNLVSSGTKGDFVFRDFDSESLESISIMFEMKNEFDESVNKKKNVEFLEKLDQDRQKKNCEYAVLVTQLEPDNELYNGGIVDVSHLYPKMFVIRPQFFIPIITILRNAAQKSIDAKRELAAIRSQNVDITNFENELNAFKSDIKSSAKLASDRYSDAIKEIDKSIKAMTELKDNLRKWADRMHAVDNKARELTVRRLTAGNPTMTAKFEELEEND